MGWGGRGGLAALHHIYIYIYISLYITESTIRNPEQVGVLRLQVGFRVWGYAWVPGNPDPSYGFRACRLTILATPCVCGVGFAKMKMESCEKFMSGLGFRVCPRVVEVFVLGGASCRLRR